VAFNKRAKFLSVVLLLIALLFFVYTLGKVTGFWTQAFGTKANLVIDTGTSFEMGGMPWNNLAQGGEEKTRMLGSVILHLSKLQPNYIRIDHVFDFYDVVGKVENGKLTYDWSKLDITLNDIHLVGAKPFISLSYMPQVISTGTEVDLPLRWEDWGDVVRETVEHISGIKGLGREGVYYEVWNEPDLFGNFKTGGSKNYLDLYYHSVKGALEAKDVYPFMIGGPATTFLSKDWTQDFLEFVSNNNLRLDFLSWHKYDYDVSKFENDVKSVRSWLENFETFKDIELVISEWGIDSENSEFYDNELSAIHTLAIVSAVFSSVDKMFSFEIKDGPGPQKYWGRWGILTNETFGVPEEKPRFKALIFLNQMKGSRMTVLGLGTWVKSFAVYDGSSYKILVVNYDKNNKHSEQVPITMVNFPAKEFIYRRINFLGGTTEKKLAADGANLKLLEYFGPNSAAIIELVPLGFISK